MDMVTPDLPSWLDELAALLPPLDGRSRCGSCLRPIANSADWDTYLEGQDQHLCWEPYAATTAVTACSPSAPDSASRLLDAAPTLLAMVRAALAVTPLAEPTFPALAGGSVALIEVREAMARVLAETGDGTDG